MVIPTINCQVINFPCKGKEMVIPNEDGSYTILLNAKLSHDGMLKAYTHAMNHIVNGDFEKTNVQEIENEAHRQHG